MHRNILVAFLVVVGSAVADDSIQQLPNNRWLSRRDFVFDTTTTSNNVAPEIEGTELEFGQQRDTRVVHRKGNRDRSEVKRKRKLKRVKDTNHHDNHNNERIETMEVTTTTLESMSNTNIHNTTRIT